MKEEKFKLHIGAPIPSDIQSKVGTLKENGMTLWISRCLQDNFGSL